jgi:ribonuclease PH
MSEQTDIAKRQESELIATVSGANELLTERNRRADEAFQRVWRRMEPGANERFNAAGRAGQDAIDPEAMETVERLVTRLAHWYLDADADRRALIVSLIADARSLRNYMCGYVDLAAKRILATRDHEMLRLGLAAVAMADLNPDFRDFYISVGHLYAEAARANLPVGAALKEVAAIAVSDRTREFLSGFETIAHFRWMGPDLQWDPSSHR